jgi:hypothetical protein
MADNFAADVAEFKTTLRELIDKECQRFRMKTGVAPKSINVRMVETTTHGDRTSQYRLAEVNVGFDF